MWGTSPLIPTEPAFPFLHLSCFSSLPAKLLVSLCSFLLCRLMFRINAGGVLCRAGGSPTCLCLTYPLHLSLWLSAWEKSLPVHLAFMALVGWSRGAVLPETHSTLTLLVTETRLGVTSGLLFPNG